jgi:hypothetical protein
MFELFDYIREAAGEQSAIAAVDRSYASAELLRKEPVCAY